MRDFKKSDLKDGMVVEYRNGTKRLVAGSILIGTNGYNQLYYYNEDLCSEQDETTIYKVYDTVFNIKDFDNKELDLLWKREQDVIKELTIEDIEKKFGCKVKIVNKEK